ncbi:hypothetical protein evm_005243, partial [Chilo suppressalis]
MSPLLGPRPSFLVDGIGRCGHDLPRGASADCQARITLIAPVINRQESNLQPLHTQTTALTYDGVLTKRTSPFHYTSQTSVLHEFDDLRGRVVCTGIKVWPTREVPRSNPGGGRCLCDKYEHLYSSHGCLRIIIILKWVTKDVWSDARERGIHIKGRCACDCSRSSDFASTLSLCTFFFLTTHELADGDRQNGARGIYAGGRVGVGRSHSDPAPQILQTR